MTSHTFKRKTVGAALLSCLSAGSAFAVHPAMTDTNGVLINPFTGKDVTPWRLVGKVVAGSGICTMTQLTRDLVLTAAHCGNVTGSTFTSPMAINGASSQLLDCHSSDSGLDKQLCRLKNPELFNSPSSYPPLTTSPFPWDLSQDPRNLKWGTFLLVGHSLPAFAAFIDSAGGNFGTDYLYPPDANPATVGFDGGDSGGAFYWISPSNQAVAYAGTIRSTGLIGTASGITHLYSVDINWILGTASQMGVVAPTVVSQQAHYGGTLNDPPPVLSSPPTVVVSGQNATVSWTAPALTPTQSIVGYKVSLGVGNQLTRQATVPNGPSTTLSVTALPLARQRVCVVAYNAISIAANDPHKSYCTEFDTRAPGATQNVTLTSGPGTLPSLRKVSAAWQPATSPDVTTSTYRVLQVQTFPSGMTTSTTATYAQASMPSVTVQKGVKFCATVTSISADKVAATVATSQCIVAN